MIVDFVSLFHMNELEIALWSLWVDKNNWHDPVLTINQLLLITGFQVKVKFYYIGSNILIRIRQWILILK